MAVSYVGRKLRSEIVSQENLSTSLPEQPRSMVKEGNYCVTDTIRAPCKSPQTSGCILRDVKTNKVNQS